MAFPGFGSGSSGIRIKFDMDDVEGLVRANKSDVAEFSKNISIGVSVALASALALKAKRLLSVDEGIGASGQAADNILVEATDDGAVVYEGPYPANRYIREGRTPTGKAKDAPPIDSIIRWAIDKRITLQPPEGAKLKSAVFGRWTKDGGQRANLSSMPSRPFKRDMRQSAAVIAKHIASEGMTSLRRKPPSGENRFDYWTEAERQSARNMNKIMAEWGSNFYLGGAMMEFINLGRRRPRILTRFVHSKLTEAEVTAIKFPKRKV